MSMEIFLRLSDEECRGIYHSIRWPGGVRCIKCGQEQRKIYRERRANLCRYYCVRCKLWFNDFTGTIFEGRRLSLRQWFQSMYLALESKQSAAEIARQIKVNRHTAEAVIKLIGSQEPWCRLILGKITRTTGKGAVSLMPFAQAQNTLGVSRRTMYRLIAAGALSAIKVGGRWRFRAEDIQKYITSKISRYGTTATGEYFYFSENVLDKYRKDKAKYYVHEEAYQGRVGSKQDYQDVHTLKSLRHQISGVKPFTELRYRKVIAPDGQHALAVSHKDYQQLPVEEYVHWSNFLIYGSKASR
ncbi:MAG: helix-turn-helix domain-containing protein [Planctomycetota bacterium]